MSRAPMTRKDFIVVIAATAILGIGFWGGLIYVVGHFVVKYW